MHLCCTTTSYDVFIGQKFPSCFVSPSNLSRTKRNNRFSNIFKVNLISKVFNFDSLSFNDWFYIFIICCCYIFTILCNISIEFSVMSVKRLFQSLHQNEYRIDDVRSFLVATSDSGREDSSTNMEFWFSNDFDVNALIHFVFNISHFPIFFKLQLNW